MEIFTCSELRSGRLTILNVGVAETPGTGIFWICDDLPEWNSFHEKVSSRLGEKHFPKLFHSAPKRSYPTFDLPESIRSAESSIMSLCPMSHPTFSYTSDGVAFLLDRCVLVKAWRRLCRIC